MIRTTITHGTLSIEFCEDGALQVTRLDNAQHIRLSITEWEFLLAAANLRGWPIAAQPERST